MEKKIQPKKKPHLSRLFYHLICSLLFFFRLIHFIAKIMEINKQKQKKQKTRLKLVFGQPHKNSSKKRFAEIFGNFAVNFNGNVLGAVLVELKS